MPDRKSGKNPAEGRSIALVALVYLYFLIFAQFGFITLLEGGGGSWRIQASMGLMALGGILGSAMAASLFQHNRALLLLRIAFVGAGVAALAAVALQGPWLPAVAGVVGFFTGLLTVSLVGWLALAVSPSRIGRVCGLGTGLGYACSNIPTLFLASGSTQALVAVAAGALGWLLSQSIPAVEAQRKTTDCGQVRAWTHWGTVAVVAAFTLLVWLDSAAFRVIQTVEALRAASWAEGPDLWMIALVHLAFALGAGWWMDRKGLVLLLLAAPLLLGLGYWGMRGPLPGSSGGWLYAAGVSLYSVALVAVMPQRSDAIGAARRAGVLFAIAGWAGSALGIGMADDLGRVPLWFWGLAFAGLCGCVLGIWAIEGRQAT